MQDLPQRITVNTLWNSGGDEKRVAAKLFYFYILNAFQGWADLVFSRIFPTEEKKKKQGGKEINRSGGIKAHGRWNSANLTYNKQNYTLLSFKLWLPSIKVSFRCINWIRHYFPIIICKVQPSILHEIPAAYRRSIYFSGLIYFHDSPIMTAMQAVHQN